MDNPIKYSDLIAGDNTIVELINQLTQLASTYKSSIAEIKQGAQDLANSLKNVNGATEQGRQATKQAAQASQELAKKWDEMTQAERDNLIVLERNKQVRKEATQMARAEAKAREAETSATKITEMSYNQLSAMYTQMKLRINSLTVEERKQAEAEEQLISKSKQVYEQMKKLQEETGKHQLNVGNYYEGVSQAFKDWGNQLPELVGGNNQLFKSFMELGSSMDGTTSVMGGLKAGFSSLWSTISGLAKNPVFLSIAGVAAAGAAFKWWYDYNSGIQEATRLTMEFTGLAGKEMQELRSEILAIAKTWGKDYKETLQGIDAVQANFGVSFQEAADAVKDGFQAGADLNGDFLSKLQQYPAYFKEAGVSVRQFVALLAQTRSGIFGDAGLDAIKQANARIREMGTQASATFDKLGMDSKQVQADLESGAKSTFEVLQEVSAKLAELPPSSQLVGETLVDVFGKQGRDAGLEMIKSLAEINTNLDEVKKGTGELGELEAQQADAEKDLQMALAELFDQTGGNFEKMKANVSLFVTKALTELIKGFQRVVNGIIDMYNKSVIFRGIWNGIAGAVKLSVATITNVLIALKDLIVGLGKSIYGVFTADWDTFEKGIKQFGMAVPKMVKAQMQSIGKIAGDAFADTMYGHIYSKGDGIRNAMQQDVLEHPEKYGIKPKSKTKDNSDDNVLNDKNVQNQMLKPVAEPKTPTASSTKGQSYTPISTTKGNGKGSTGNKPAKDPVKAMEDEFKARWRVYQEDLKRRRQYEDSQLVMTADNEQREKQAAEYKFARQIKDLEDTKLYYSELGKINAKNNLSLEQQKWIDDQITALQLQMTEEKLRIERQYQIQRNEVEKEGIEMKLKSVKEGSDEELELRKKALELERDTALKENMMKPLEEQISSSDIDKAFDAELAKLTQEYAQHKLDLYDKEQEYYQSEFDLLTKSEREKTQYQLKAERDRLKKMLELNEKYGGMLSDVEKAAIENQIKKLDGEIKSTPHNDIYDIFGLSLDNEQKQAIDQSLQYATNALTSFMESYIQAADAKKAAADQEVEDSKKVLEAEIEARNQGYASDVVTAQKELDLARKNQEKARKQAQKAHRAQMALDTAQQASSMITATANIWSAFTKLGPWGVAAAIAATALMWGSFTASKIKALTMANGGDETYGEGTVQLLSGGSHQSGNDIDLGTTPDGRRRRAEGGEFFAVINKRNSRRFRKQIPDVINSLNDGSFGVKYMNAYKTDDGVIFNISASSEEMKAMSADVSAIRKAQEHKVYVDNRGNVIEVYRNVKRTTRR